MRFFIVALSALLVLNCGGDSGGDDDTVEPVDTVVAEDTVQDTAALDTQPVDVEQPEPGTGCDPHQRVGRFEIFNDPMGSWVSGVVTDGISVYDQILQEKESEDGCTLWMGMNPNFCDPQCVAGEECGQDGVCRPAPQRRSVGTVTVAGLIEPLELEPNYALEYKTWDFDGPPYEDNAAIEIKASGDELGGFSLSGVGVPPLEVETTEWIITPGQPLDITWSPVDGPWKIWLEVNVDQHGLSPVTLRCTLPDTGAHTIPASLIDKLIEYGASGAASGRIHRRSVDSAQIAEGCIDLEVYTWQQVYPKCQDCPCTTPGLCPE